MNSTTTLNRSTSARGRVRRLVRVFVLGLGLAVFAWWPMLVAYPNTQSGDGPPFHKMLEAARVSVVRYHELPLWNPYECGGIPLWDNPQAPIAAPLVWSMLLVGTTAAMYLWYVLHSALGFCSMWFFARDEVKLSRAGTFVASVAWTFSGFHQQHYAGGHFAFVPFLYFPLAFLLWRRAASDLRYAIGLGWLVAWMMHEGAVYPLPHLSVFLFAETLTRVSKRSLARITRAAAVVMLVGLFVGAARFLPVMDQLRSHVRPIGVENDSIRWETLRDMFLARHHARGAPGQSYVWPEYGSYLGPFLFAFAAVGLLFAAFEAPWLVLLFGVAFVLMMGHFSPVAPWAVLKGNVFPFKEMRVPSRFRCEVLLFLAVFAGLAVDRLPKIAVFLPGRPTRAVRTLALGVALIGAGDMIAVGIEWFGVCFGNPPEQRVAASTRLYVHGPALAAMIDQPRQNRIRLACWDEWAFGVGAPMWEGDIPQARPAPGARAIVEAAHRTQNTFTFDVVADERSRILLNGTYDRGWRSDAGVVAEQDKLLVVDVPAGRHHVTLRYWPRGLTLGFILASFGLIASALAMRHLSQSAREVR